MLDLALVLQKGFEAGAAKLFSNAVESGFKAIQTEATAKVPRVNFRVHLSSMFSKCSQTKTLINPDNPVPLMDLYVSNSFSIAKRTEEGRTIDDFAMIEEIWEKRRVVLTGSAGTGKSFFTKYFWLAAFENSHGKIPIYIELRGINELTTASLMSYVFRTVVENNETKEATQEFEKAVRAGRFVFIFDGFDEIREDRRKVAENEIMMLSKLGPDNIILITSRPDELFQAWQEFWCYHVERLEKKQVIELLNKISFDPITKKQFIERVKKDLYDKHTSLLSTPLLATIMLLTFRSFADIPNKIHVFYEQAFETLFARHDALKDSFKRQFSTNLPIDVFKNQFSAFCLLTYDQEFYTFSEAQALEYIEKSKRITGLEFENSNFLKDLFESVCMLQRDGMSIVFCHRSFQEFFAARFIARLSREKTEKLLPKYLYRMSDGTGSMLYDMNNDLVEECFLVPKFLSFREKLVTQSKLSGIEKTCKALGCNCEVTVYKRINRADIEEFSIRFSDIEYTRFMDLVLQLFNVDLGEENQGFNSLIEKDATASAQLAKLKEFIPFFPDKSSFKKTVIYSNGWQVDKLFAKSLETAFKRGGYTVYRSLMAQRTRQLCESMMEARKSRNNSLDALLKI